MVNFFCEEKECFLRKVYSFTHRTENPLLR